MTETIAAGLDFGTTNSTLGVAARGGPAQLLPVEGDATTIPSALFFSLEDGRTYFGRQAVREYVEGAEGRFMRALKSILGTSLMKETTLIGRERMSFQDLIGRFLRHMRERLEAANVPADRIVLGRPVHFVDDDPVADRTAQDQLAAAARAEGFSHVEFQFEPVAAALYRESAIDREELALIVDIGGGTSDFSLVRLSPERARASDGASDRSGDILASAGVHIGGTDFDRMMSIRTVMPHFGLGTMTSDGKRSLPVWYFNDMATWHRINFLYTPQVRRDIAALAREAAEPARVERFAHLIEHRSGHRLAGAVEAAKISLTDAPHASVHLPEPGLDVDLPVSQAAFAAATQELVARIGRTLKETLDSAGVAHAAVDSVILTGGGAEVPAIQAAVTALLPQSALLRSDAFGSVGMGLALDAARRFA